MPQPLQWKSKMLKQIQLDRGIGCFCYACDKPLMMNAYEALTIDNQLIWVGADCARKIAKANKEGWQPPKGGPKLFDPSRRVK